MRRKNPFYEIPAIIYIEISPIFQEEIEIIFTVIFTSECAMKIVAYGFISHQNAYLKLVTLLI